MWYFKLHRLKSLDDRVASLQREKEHLTDRDGNPDEVTAQLRTLSGKRERVSMEYDKKLVRDISDYISDISKDYDIYVSIGKLKGIRNAARRGNFRGKGSEG